MEQSGNLQWMIEEGWKRDLQVNTLPAQLQECLPELHPNDGPHAIFEQPLERDRAESSCICGPSVYGPGTTRYIPMSYQMQQLMRDLLPGVSKFTSGMVLSISVFP